MIRKIIILYFMTVVTPWGHAQDLKPLLKESTRFIQVIPGDTGSWQQERRYFYSYNSKRLPVYRNYQNYDHEDEKWDLITEYMYKYDDSGNRIYDHIVRNNEKGELIREFEVKRDYMGSLEVSRTTDFSNYETDYWEKRWTTWEYDENDSLVFHSTRFKDSNFTEKIYEDKIYYNENGCKIIEVDSEESIYLNSSTISKDSIVTEYDNVCRILNRNYYQIGIFQTDYNLYYQLKVDRSFNSQGLVESEIHSENSSYTFGWTPYYSMEYTYDPKGRIISETNVNLSSGRENRVLFRYNENDRIIWELHQQKNSDTALWVNQYQYEVEFISDTLLLNESFVFDWSQNAATYTSTFMRQYDYDENYFLIKRTETQTGINIDNQMDFFASIEYTFNNRCDGQVLSWEVNEIENENAPGNFLGEKYENKYYENAPCDYTANNENEFRIFPNPSHGDINVFKKFAFGESDISVINQQGKVVYYSNRYLNNYFSIDLNGLPSGLYILRIKNDEVDTTEKFLLVN